MCEGGAGRAGHAMPARDSDNDSVEELGKDELEEVMEEMALRRAAWLVEHEDDSISFPVIIRGGRWTRLHRGRTFDNVCCIARRGLPAVWCELFGFGRMASFSIRLYSEALATTLAR